MFPWSRAVGSDSAIAARARRHCKARSRRYRTPRSRPPSSPVSQPSSVASSAAAAVATFPAAVNGDRRTGTPDTASPRWTCRDSEATAGPTTASLRLDFDDLRRDHLDLGIPNGHHDPEPRLRRRRSHDRRHRADGDGHARGCSDRRGADRKRRCARTVIKSVLVAVPAVIGIFIGMVAARAPQPGSRTGVRSCSWRPGSA